MKQTLVVYSASISHSHGTDIFMAGSQEELNQKLAHWCDSWADDVGETDGAQVRRLFAQGKFIQCVDLYFNHQDAHGSESIDRFTPTPVEFTVED